MSGAFSVLVLARGEEANIGPCVRNARRFSDDVIVLDSGSTDRTQEVARAAGARVLEHPFHDFASQRNFGVRFGSPRHEWVFHLDADERLTPALARECLGAVRANRHSGYFVPAKQIVAGRWLRHAAAYPVFQMRFHRIGEVEFVQSGHGQREGPALRGLGILRHSYLHYPLSKGLADWFERHNRYSSEEARLLARELGASNTPSLIWRVVTGDALERRRALKTLSGCLPFPGLLVFLYLYIVKAGFLDGRPGWDYCRLQAIYREMIRLKMRAGGSRA